MRDTKVLLSNIDFYCPVAILSLRDRVGVQGNGLGLAVIERYYTHGRDCRPIVSYRRVALIHRAMFE